MNRPDHPEPKPGVMEIAPYVPGKSEAPAGVAKVYKLSSNENPLGASPKAIEAVRRLAEKMEFYPDGSAARLREAIGAAHGLNPANIVCSNGSDEIIGLLAQTYLTPGDEGIFTEHGFMRLPHLHPGGRRRAGGRQRRPASAPTSMRSSPRSPSGRRSSSSPIRTIRPGPICRSRKCAGCMRRCRSDVLLVLDAAYAEYVRRNDYESGIELVSSSQNVVMTRTFSKVHGLGGMRIGWVYAPAPIVDALNRMRGPFNVNAAAIEAGVAAMGDRAHIEKTVAHNDNWLSWLTQELTRLGLRVTPSVGNFVLDPFSRRCQAFGGSGRRLSDRSAAISCARVSGYGFPNALAHDGRHRGRQSRCRRSSRRIPRAVTMAEPLFQKIALVGIGLIGSSLAHVVRREKLAGHIAISTRSAADAETRRRAGPRRFLLGGCGGCGARRRPGRGVGAGRRVG